MLIEALAKTSRIEEVKLLNIASSASKRYKIYKIPKRSGGMRTIQHPSKELKAIQRWLVRAIFSRFPVHQAATAYRSGSGIRENAERHRRSKYTNRYDFSNYFPSFRQHQVESFLRLEAQKLDIRLTDGDILFVGKIVCRHGRLTIGAPSSPAITNSMMFDFDQSFYRHCVEKGLIYTRYADDLFVSSDAPNQLSQLENEIQRIKRNISHLSLRLNHRKTTYLSKKYARKITGVFITPEHKLSIGRERKREIKSLIYRWINNNLDVWEVPYMRGLLAFARDIEPEFEDRLKRKYGSAVIDEILRNPSLQKTPDQNYIQF